MRLPDYARSAVLQRLRFQPGLLLRQMRGCYQFAIKVLRQLRLQVELN
jgi:hypothetical protein